MITDIQIMRLGAEWASLYRDLRLEALKNHPDHYAASFEEEAAWPLEAFAHRLAVSRTFGLLRGDALVGIATLFPVSGALMRHKAELVGVYVRPEERGRKLGRAMLKRVLAEETSEFEQVNVSVAAHNAPALRLYESLGFVRYGYEKRAAKIGAAYCDDVLMAKAL